MSDTTAALANFSRQIPEPALTTGCPAQVIQSVCTLAGMHASNHCFPRQRYSFIFSTLWEIDSTMWDGGKWSRGEKKRYCLMHYRWIPLKGMAVNVTCKFTQKSGFTVRVRARLHLPLQQPINYSHYFKDSAKFTDLFFWLFPHFRWDSSSYSINKHRKKINLHNILNYFFPFPWRSSLLLQCVSG